MIEFGKITGNMEGNLYQVMLREGECLYAPIAVMGNNVSAPSEKWVQANKDKFLALVTYEKDIFESPVIVGFFPVKGAKSEEYNVHERLVYLITRLVKQLQRTKINTQLGPQQFMPDTIYVLEEIENGLKEIDEDTNKLEL